MMDNQSRRVDDTFVGKVVKLWPILLGLSGFLYAVITNYNMVKSNTDSIYKLNSTADNLTTRIAAIEKDMAVKNSQFTVILSRTDRIEDKLDKLVAKR